MKKFLCLAATVLFASATAMDAAADSPTGITSGPSVGDYLGPFAVTKVAGATEDGVKEGSELCYRCKNKQRPQVVVFTRSTDGKVNELVKKLDQAMEEHSEDQLRVFVNVLSDSQETATKNAKSMASDSGAQNVPFVVPRDHATGPKNYSLSSDADITITMANDSEVKGNLAFASAQDIDVDMVMDKVTSMLQ